MDEFKAAVADILCLEPEEVTMELDFRTVEDWSSLMGFGLLVMMEQDYGVKISVPEFLKIATVGELYAKVGK